MPNATSLNQTLEVSKRLPSLILHIHFQLVVVGNQLLDLLHPRLLELEELVDAGALSVFELHHQLLGEARVVVTVEVAHILDFLQPVHLAKFFFEVQGVDEALNHEVHVWI